MAHHYTELLVAYILLPFVYGNYPPNGTYLYEERSKAGYFGVQYGITFPYDKPHMVTMYIDSWNTTGLDGEFPLTDSHIPEGCSLDLRDHTYSQLWKKLSTSIAEGARYGGRNMNKGDLETLITETDSQGEPYIELTFNTTKLHLKKVD
ncbi:hypothetical protein FOL47_009221 [Perkinsus chesapeaki]|uniref:Uncharacterized protein n=1 Tax=Perkinsus chesapeaki TaxID=330153 RepID=A0A7J6L9M6_PERCH|nr:hypothetical protein FOL47_009221 [Perkinsus chesapeaki]